MAVLPLPVYYNVNCFAVNEFGPLRRLTGALKVCSAAFLFWLFKIQAASFLLELVSSFFLWFCLSDASLTIYSVEMTF